MYGNASNAVTTMVAAATSATPLLPADTRNGRKCASLYYDAAAILYVLVGDTGPPSTTNYTFKMGQGLLTYWEGPAGINCAINGLWSAATGSVAVAVYT
jgi:hypothetical protein